jgi:hypothetical protein
LAKTREQLEIRAEAQEQESAPTPVAGAHSTTRSTKKWRLHGVNKASVDQAYDALLNGILQGVVPREAVKLDSVFINSLPIEDVARWPGIEIYVDVQIIGRILR